MTGVWDAVQLATIAWRVRLNPPVRWLPKTSAADAPRPAPHSSSRGPAPVLRTHLWRHRCIRCLEDAVVDVPRPGWVLAHGAPQP